MRLFLVFFIFTRFECSSDLSARLDRLEALVEKLLNATGVIVNTETTHKTSEFESNKESTLETSENDVKSPWVIPRTPDGILMWLSSKEKDLLVPRQLSSLVSSVVLPTS